MLYISSSEFPIGIMYFLGSEFTTTNAMEESIA